MPNVLLLVMVEVRVQHLQRLEIVHFDAGTEGDYSAHVTFFAREKRVRNVT